MQERELGELLVQVLEGTGVNISYSYKDNAFRVSCMEGKTFQANSIRAHAEFLYWLSEQTKHPKEVHVVVVDKGAFEDVDTFQGILTRAVTSIGMAVGRVAFDCMAAFSKEGKE